jgi:hypothetical protein
MKYKLVRRKNPQDRESQGKWYTAPVNDDKVSQQDSG